MATIADQKLTPAEVVAAIDALGGTMGVTAAAREIGIRAPNFKRDAAPRLTALPVDGSADVYFRSEVLELARQVRERRAARASNGDGDGAGHG